MPAEAVRSGREAGPPLRLGRSDVGGAGQARSGAGRGPGPVDRCAPRGCGGRVALRGGRRRRVMMVMKRRAGSLGVLTVR